MTRRIAVGGMGEVWAGVDTVLGRTVAIKFLREELVDTPGFLTRFRAEARHTAALAHPGIAAVYDYGEETKDDGACVAYLVMELVDGRPLSEILHERGALPVDMALSVLSQTADALHAAHARGVVHRDVKPGNLLVLDDGKVKVTDFGVARAIDSTAITQIGQVVGTARYLSPEQASGGAVTPASDLYSLGVIGYEMLAGHPPFAADNPAALAMAHAHQPPPPLPAHVPEPVRASIERALSKDPAQRPADARAFAAELHQLRAALPTGTASEAPTRVMDVGEGPRTAIMPIGVVRRVGGAGVGGGALGVARHISEARRQRRWIVVTAIVAVLVLALAFAQRGVDDLPRVVPTSLPAEPVPTTTVVTTPPTTAAPAVEVNNQPGNGHGKGKNKKDRPNG